MNYFSEERSRSVSFDGEMIHDQNKYDEYIYLWS